MALTDDELASAKADAELAKVEAESAREALNQAIENFKNSEEFKEEILKGGFASYCIGYKDGRDTVRKLYPDLDLSSIIPFVSEDGAAKEEAAPIEDIAPTAEDGAPTAPEDVPVADAALKQGDGGDDW